MYETEPKSWCASCGRPSYRDEVMCLMCKYLITNDKYNKEYKDKHYEDAYALEHDRVCNAGWIKVCAKDF